jgi:hypothetical protein
MLMSYDTLPNSSMDSSVNPKGENNERIRSGAHSSAHNTLGEKGCAKALGWGLGRVISKSITRMDLHKPNNKLVNA